MKELSNAKKRIRSLLKDLKEEEHLYVRWQRSTVDREAMILALRLVLRNSRVAD